MKRNKSASRVNRSIESRSSGGIQRRGVTAASTGHHSFEGNDVAVAQGAKRSQAAEGRKRKPKPSKGKRRGGVQAGHGDGAPADIGVIDLVKIRAFQPGQGNIGSWCPSGSASLFLERVQPDAGVPRLRRNNIPSAAVMLPNAAEKEVCAAAAVLLLAPVPTVAVRSPPRNLFRCQRVTGEPPEISQAHCPWLFVRHGSRRR